MPINLTNKFTKAEILFTRKCNLSCSFCSMPREQYEMSIYEWEEALKKLKSWGVEFLAIYGAEPLIEFEKLVKFIELCKCMGFEFTVISNGILLTEEKAIKLKEAGLESFTMSADIGSYDDSSKAKSISCSNNLSLAQKYFKDVEVIVTVFDEHSLTNFPKFIQIMSELYPDVWVSFDLLHWDNGRDDSKCPTTHLDTLPPEALRTILTGLADCHPSKLHQTPEALRILANSSHDMNYWHCTKPSMLSIDCDGSIRVCDDHKGFNRNILNTDLETFIEEWGSKAEICPGCIWSTHIMSEQMQGDSQEYFTHKVN